MLSRYNYVPSLLAFTCWPKEEDYTSRNIGEEFKKPVPSWNSTRRERAFSFSDLSSHAPVKCTNVLFLHTSNVESEVTDCQDVAIHLRLLSDHTASA